MTASDRAPEPRLLRLYPARYRNLHGPEIAAVHAQATAGLTGLPLLREHSDLAAHALRLRTRLSSTDPAGRIAAGAAPFALAGAAGLSLLLVVVLAPDILSGGLGPGLTALAAVDNLPWIAALACALTGRWTPARMLSLLATAVKTVLLIIATWPSPTTWRWLIPLGEGAHVLWFSVALGVLVVLAPPDLVDVARQRNRRVIGAAALLGAPLTVALGYLLGHNVGPGSLSYLLLYCWPGLLPATAVLVLLTRPRPDPLRTVGIGLTALPWAVVFSDDSQLTVHHIAAATTLACAPLAGAALLAAVVRIARARTVPQPSDPA
ncbi:hypothetical protein [Streptacidiphilus carbonis]|jgi:hypothetical protein|uniref:hypothetical protein n=1 Tax=Streptacidiphilus carbonis TaxID=105422 RepID=UPI0006935D74|nr:hypothetical protein [Streptacidiphilus carbonis]